MHVRSVPLFRLFFALKPGIVHARRTDHFVESLFGDVPRVRMDDQHVTLGITIDYEDYPYTIIKALLRAGTTVRADPFLLTLDRLSISNRSAALRPSRAIPPLSDLQRKIADAIRRAAVPVRPGWSFSPHQTLLYRNGRPDQRSIEGLCWPVEEFFLICSHVGPTHHETLGRWPLRGNGQYSLF